MYQYKYMECIIAGTESVSAQRYMYGIPYLHHFPLQLWWHLPTIKNKKFKCTSKTKRKCHPLFECLNLWNPCKYVHKLVHFTSSSLSMIMQYKMITSWSWAVPSSVQLGANWADYYLLSQLWLELLTTLSISHH